MTTTPAPGRGDPAAVDPRIMAARYGRRPAAQGSRRGVVVAAVAAALVAIAAIVVQAVSLSGTSVRTEGVGFTVADPTRTTVRFNVITDEGATVRCTLTALNENFTEVGFREVVIGPVAAPVTPHEVDVTTTELATTGSVSTCEVVDAP